MFDTESYTEIVDGDVPSVLPSDMPAMPSQRPTVRSATARRAEEWEESAAVVILDTLFSSRDAPELAERLRATVWGTAQFERLPLHRRRFLEGFYEGAQEAAARFVGSPSSRHAAEQARVPPAIRRLQPGARWKRHPNGGGWVSHTAYVSQSAYVGPDAAVFDQARVTEYARVYGQARVCDQAELSGHARVRAQGVVGGEAKLSGYVTIAGGALVMGRVVADGREVVRDHADVVRLGLPEPATVRPPTPHRPSGTFFEELRPERR